jgi:dolichol-phosphate mannosyltransferase
MTDETGSPAADPAQPRISVVIPMKNEEGNVAPLIAEIANALHSEPHEIIAVNDGSTDETATILSNLRGAYPQLRVLHHAESRGQSAAIRDGALAARGEILCTLDGDGQNNPAFLPGMIARLDADPAIGLVQGQRVGRTDTGFKKLQSRLANAVRGAMLRDGTRDSGCGLKVMRRAAYLRLPFFDALHRFTPALMVRDGHTVAHLDVVDRPRGSGVSNYRSWARAKVALIDLIGVWWLIRRRKPDTITREEV